MKERTTVFATTTPSGHRTVVRLTARRQTGPPPAYAFNIWAHIWMAADFQSGAVYPNWTVAETDMHQLAEGYRRMTSRLALGDVSTEPFGIVVSELAYSNVDWVEGLVCVVMAHWLAEEFDLDTPGFHWESDNETGKDTLHLDS